MASFRELPIVIQVLIFALLSVALIAAYVFVPGGISPLQNKRVELEEKKTQAANLQRDVTQLQGYEQKRSDLRTEIENLKKQLDIAKSIVPEEKEVDEFMRILQGEASSAGVAIRRISSKPPSPRDYYIELPFEVEADGPYYSVLDFFTRLGRIPRVINVGDLTMTGYQEARGKKYPARPGTTVTGTFTATTFFTGGAQGPPPAAPAKGKQPGKQQPGKR